MDEYLSGVYFDPSQPESFGGVKKLHDRSRADGKDYSLADVKDWLSQQETYTLFAPPVLSGSIRRPRVVVGSKFQQFDSDTASMTAYAKVNDGLAYFLVVIDIFTRYAWTRPLRTLTAKESLKALKSVLNEQKCRVLRTDGGSEFVNRWVDGYLKRKVIKHVVTRNETKANFAERLIKTLKSRLVKDMFHRKSKVWGQRRLAEVTEAYNSSVHRSIGMTPVYAATKAERADLWNAQYGVKLKRKKTTSRPSGKRPLYKFETGDVVRIERFREPFTREYDEHWTHELFVVADRDTQQGIPMYVIKDYANKEIEGKFYTRELIKVKVHANTKYRIEKVLRKTKRNGKPGYIVSWKGWKSPLFDSFVPAEDLEEGINTE